MTRHLEAIYQGGVLRPLQPLDLDENQKVSVTVSAFGEAELLDTDYLHFCEQHADDSVTLATVREALAGIRGSMTDDFSAEREDRF